MAESELLLQPEILAELQRYRALERRLQVSHQHCQQFNELAKQVAPANAPTSIGPIKRWLTSRRARCSPFRLKATDRDHIPDRGSTL